MRDTDIFQVTYLQIKSCDGFRYDFSYLIKLIKEHGHEMTFAVNFRYTNKDKINGLIVS